MHLLLICLFSCFITGEGEKTFTTKNDTVNFEIEITRLVFGRPATITKVNSEKIEAHLFNNGPRAEPDIITRDLELEEIAYINDFLENFPLSKLEESYIYPGVKDGIEMRFSIKKGNVDKNIFIGNYFQEDLGALVLVVSELFDEDYIRYNRDRLPYPKD